MKRVKRSKAQGYVLIMVLVILLVLTLLVAGLYSASEESRFTSQTMLGQRVAAARADQAAQLAIAALRGSLITPSVLAGLTSCTTPVTKLRSTGSCVGGNFIDSTLISGPALSATTTLENGAGLQYRWWVYKPSVNLDGTPAEQAASVFTVYAEGYFGDAETRANFTIAAVSAEITLPAATSGPPVFDGDYGVIH